LDFKKGADFLSIIWAPVSRSKYGLSDWRPFSFSRQIQKGCQDGLPFKTSEMEVFKMSQIKEAAEYQKLMEQAPKIKASGLEGDYRALAEFNNVVLAGHQTQFGMEFVTWEWVQSHTSLWQGHYYGDNYAADKQDFVTRSGLLQREGIFSDQQLTEMYRCIHETLESGYPITPEREKLLTESAGQIEAAVPNLEELVQRSNEAELALTQEDDLGMTQRF